MGERRTTGIAHRTIKQLLVANPGRFPDCLTAGLDEIREEVDQLINKAIYIALKEERDAIRVVLEINDDDTRVEILVLLEDDLLIRERLSTLTKNMIAHYSVGDSKSDPCDLITARRLRADLQGALDLAEAAVSQAEKAAREEEASA